MKMLVTCRYSFYRRVHFKKMHYVIILNAFLLNGFVCNVGCAMNRLWSVVFVDNFYKKMIGWWAEKMGRQIKHGDVTWMVLHRWRYIDGVT